jgi:ABC-type xylose transport system permease subunit
LHAGRKKKYELIIIVVVVVVVASMVTSPVFLEKRNEENRCLQLTKHIIYSIYIYMCVCMNIIVS